MKNETDQLRLFSDINLDEYEKGKDELNLAEFPFAIAGKDTHRTGNTSVTYQDLIRDRETGKEVTRMVTIQGSDEFGLPTYYDEEILFGVVQLTNLQRNGDDWPTEVRFSRYHLAKVLGLPTDGRTYRRIWDSLHRLAKTNYHLKFAFFDKTDEEWRPSIVINFISTLTVHGGPVPGKNGEVTIRWNEDIHRNFQAGYLRSINVAEYRSIGLPLAKALYRYLGKRFYRSPRLKFDLKVLAFEKLGISRSYNVGQIKRAIDPAIHRLEEHGFIRPATREERYQKIRPGEWKVIFEKNSPQHPLPMKIESPSALEGNLIEQGVNASTASRLVEQYPPELIERKIDECLFLVRQGKGPTSNPGAWLTKSIQEAWDSPPDYKSEEELAAIQKQREEQEEKKRKAARGKKDAKEEYETITKLRSETAQTYFDELTEEERDQLKEKVIEGEKGILGKKLWKIFAMTQIEEELEAAGVIPPLPPRP